MDREEGAPRQPSLAFFLLYALANTGAVVAYTPFLMFVLPVRVAELAGPADIHWLGYIVFGGAVAASLSGVLSGWLSDRLLGRRTWVAAGLAGTIGIQLAMMSADDIGLLLGLIIAWQVALNMMLIPLLAWAADVVPDGKKGILGGLLAVAPALGAWAGIALTFDVALSFADKLWIINLLTLGAVAPLLLFGTARALDGPVTSRRPSHPAKRPLTAAAVRMWTARLCMQISGAALASYLYYWFRGLDPGMSDAGKVILFATGVTAAVAVALALGRWTDRHGRPFAILALLAFAAGVGLVVMALAPDILGAKMAYLVFGTAGAAFLALHAGQMLRVLPDPERRGRDIGIFNLTNTAPLLIMPWLAISVVPGFGFERLFFLLALLAFAAAAMLMTIPKSV